MSKKGKPGVMIYFETARAVKRCSYEEKGRLFEAILEYAEFGVVPDLPPPLDMAWAFIVDKLDRDNERYAEVQEKNQLKGWTSDFKRNYAPEHGLNPEDKVELAKYIEQKRKDSCGQTQLTVADNGQPIQPSTSATATATATASASASETAATPAKDKKIHCPARPEKKTADMRYNDLRREAIDKLSSYGG